MTVLILGSGGREHAIAWKVSKSSMCKKLIIAPGNAGTLLLGENIDIDISDFSKIKEIVINYGVDMLIVGPEDPLVKGVYDFFKQDPELNSITVIGPSKKGAKLEGSKDFAKEFMLRNNIPTSAYKTFDKTTINDGIDFLNNTTPPYVLKADGLAAGKGVVILEDLEEAKRELKSMIIDKKFGNAGGKVVIEEFLEGIEISVFIVTDGDSYKILPTAKDYKRIGEGDRGLNTGGMGAISPVNFADRFFMERVESEIIKPTIEGLKKEKIEYQGFLFFGLINVKGDPKVIEYNVRLGDPEAEVVVPRIKSDLLNMLKGIGDGTLSEKDLNISDSAAVTVVMSSGGYPQKYEINKEITGLENVMESIVFHSGTKNSNGKLLTAGGRVLTVTSLDPDIRKALQKSYSSIKKISFQDNYYRKDIGLDLSN